MTFDVYTNYELPPCCILREVPLPPRVYVLYLSRYVFKKMSMLVCLEILLSSTPHSNPFVEHDTSPNINTKMPRASVVSM